MESPSEVSLQVGGPAECDGCHKRFTHGGRVVLGSSDAALYYCQWCIAFWLTDITGFEVALQLRAWIMRKNRWRKYKELGWTGKGNRTPLADDSISSGE